MRKLSATDPETRSLDLITENIERLKALFPEIITEGLDGASVNVDVLRQLVGDKTVSDYDEKYGLNWYGKRRARQLALTPSIGTLRPCPEDSVDWDTTQNLMIEGDNLEVLKLLQKSYAGKVKLIYIDPPYNTGHDFVYPDDFQDSIKNYLELTRQVEGGKKLSSNTEASGRFHTDWLNMMYPRLKLARNLLRDDGLIFISIDDNEAPNLRVVCNEVFGEENFINEAVIRRGAKSVHAQFETWDKLGSRYERVLIYSRMADYRFPKQEVHRLEFKEGTWNNHWRGTNRPTLRYELFGITPESGQWRWGEARSIRAVEAYHTMLVELGTTTPTGEQIDAYYLSHVEAEESVDFLRLSRNGKPEHYVPPTGYSLLNDVWFDLPVSSSGEVRALFDGQPIFDNPKPTELVRRVLRFGSETDIVMDFFAGSGTTGHAVLAGNAADGGNRRYILVQLPEPLEPKNKDQKIAAKYCDQLGKPRNIAELTKERLRRAGAKIQADNPEFVGDVGFRVFKLDSGNIRIWDSNPEDLGQTLFDAVENIVPGRSEADILHYLLLERGLDLCEAVQTEIIAGKAVQFIGGGELVACLADRVEAEDVEALTHGILSAYEALRPTAQDAVCVFRDNAFADDVTKTNLVEILAQHGLTNVKCL